MNNFLNNFLDRINEDTFIISDTHLGHKRILEFEPCRLTQMRIDGYEADEHDKWVIDNWNSVVKPNDTILHLGDFAFRPGFYTDEFLDLVITLQNKDMQQFKRLLKLKKPKTLKEIKEFVLADSKEKTNIDKDFVKSIVTRYIPEKECYIRYKDLLNGNIILVLGNHDPKPRDNKLKGMKVVDGFYWEYNNIPLKVQNDNPMFSGFIKEINKIKYYFSHYEIHTKDKWDFENENISPRISAHKEIFEKTNCDFNIHGHIHSSRSSSEFSKNVSFEKIGFKPIKLKEIIK